MSVATWFAKIRTSEYRLMPSAGIYHYANQEDEDRNRIHLRIEKDGNGLLMVNAARAYHLNPSATAMAFWYLNGGNQSDIIHALQKNFQITKSQATNDTSTFIDQLTIIADPHDSCPICELDLDMDMPFSHIPSAPYRMDLAITYRCNNDCTHCYNARSRNYPELETKDWLRIIDKLWDIGVPHIVFTGGEPTLRNDLPQLIAYAENKGQITGINTNGRRLADKSYLHELINAGLDHIQITLESADRKIHDEMVNHSGAWEKTVAGIKNVVAEKIYMMTNTTMLSTNLSSIPQTLDFLAELKVPTVGLNALIYSGKGKNVGTGLREQDLEGLLTVAKQKTEQYQQKLIWYTPTEYCKFNPITNELGVKGCSAALYNMCIEPDGAVLPCQSFYVSLGNFLENSWDSIWNHEISLGLREKRNLPEKCIGCELVQECGGGCPLTHLDVN